MNSQSVRATQCHVYICTYLASYYKSKIDKIKTSNQRVTSMINISTCPYVDIELKLDFQLIINIS